MFNWFSRKQKTPPQPEAADWESKLEWLRVGDAKNPFPDEVLDCRAVALAFTSWSKDPSIANRFVALRSSDGRQYINQLPAGFGEISSQLSFAYGGQHNDGPIVKASTMEQKWDFFAYDNRLYISRSWQGELSFVATLEYGETHVTIDRIYYAPTLVEGQPTLAEHQLQFLVLTYFEKKVVPFPIPKSRPRVPKDIALYGFSLFGNAAQFAYYPETT